jgi:hypothetical protein
LHRRTPVIADKKIWYDARNETKIDALPSKHQGLIVYEMTAQMKNPLFTLMNLGESAARSLPAGREFSKMEEKIAQYANMSAMEKHPARLAAVYKLERKCLYDARIIRHKDKPQHKMRQDAR